MYGSRATCHRPLGGLGFSNRQAAKALFQPLFSHTECGAPRLEVCCSLLPSVWDLCLRLVACTGCHGLGRPGRALLACQLSTCVAERLSRCASVKSSRVPVVRAAHVGVLASTCAVLLRSCYDSLLELSCFLTGCAGPDMALSLVRLVG